MNLPSKLLHSPLFHHDLDHLFETFFGADRVPSARPALNVVEEEGGYLVHLDVPGASVDDLEIAAKDRLLTVRGRIPATEGTRTLRRERVAGAFERSAQLPADVDLQNIKASLENGVLTIQVPKSEAAKPRRISIEQGD